MSCFGYGGAGTYGAGIYDERVYGCFRIERISRIAARKVPERSRNEPDLVVNCPGGFMLRYVTALITALACTPNAGMAQGSVVIRNVTVLPMTGAGPIANQSVVIRNGRIAEIGPSAQIGSRWMK